MEIIEGIHRVDEASSNIAHSNVYVVINGKELSIIDTGTSGNAKKTVEYIQKMGHQPEDVTAIIITHFHMDHTGSLKELKSMLPNAKVFAHEADADFISGKKPYPKPKNLLFRAVSSFVKPEAVPVDVALKEDDKVGELIVKYVPGHTPGSIALLDERRKALFAGDTLRFDGKKLSAGSEQFTMDMAQAKESIKKLSQLDFDVMLPGHGEPLKTNASVAVKEFAESLK
ncbi:MAG TPA: MBL fold metallo-hydrolase [Candidatus Acidoferrales bacterium]|nr:MBL fold metallo-hydrolase [Candidatus Acidoferrales bacterium]